MAKIKYGTGLDGLTGLYYYALPRDDFFIDTFTERRVAIGIVEGGHVELDGKNFIKKQGLLVDGTVTKMTFTDEQGDAVFTMSGLEFEIRKNFNFNFVDIITESILGNDKVIGSSVDDTYMFGGAGRNKFAGLNGSDVIYSSGGWDTATGKLGSDYFYFQPVNDVNKQTLTITDFDANGGGDQQDYLYWTPELEYRAFERGDDLVILFEQTKSKIVLENVSFPEFTQADIQVPPEFPL